MTDNSNIEKGLAEISRREYLTVASLGLVLPYCLLVIWPAYSHLGKSAAFVSFIPFLIFHGLLHVWVSKSRCPRCGQAIGHSPWGPSSWKCRSCSIEIKPPKWFGQKISFKRINYDPGAYGTQETKDS